MKVISKQAKAQHEARLAEVKAHLDDVRTQTSVALQQQTEDRLAELDASHAQMLDNLGSEAPQPVTLKQHPEGEPPKVIEVGDAVVTVMAGDYYYADDNSAFVVTPADVGKGGAWQEVK